MIQSSSLSHYICQVIIACGILHNICKAWNLPLSVDDDDGVDDSDSDSNDTSYDM